MFILAAAPGLPLILLFLAAPTVVVMLIGYWHGTTFRQRIANLILAFFCAFVAVAALGLLRPAPGSWVDENYGLLVFAVAPIGAVLGSAMAIGGRNIAKRWQR